MRSSPLALIATLCVATPVVAQQGTTHAAPWKELDAFHVVLGATWHPAKGRQDLAPIRAKAGALADAARRWSASRGPAACSDSATTAAVARIATDARALAALVATPAPDADVVASLAALHERFEPLEQRCGSEMEHDMKGMAGHETAPAAARAAKRPDAKR